MKITMYKHDMERLVHPDMIEQLEAAGWTRDGQAVVDAGAVKLKAPKKKAEKPAEIEPEAAIEDLDNANQGE